MPYIHRACWEITDNFIENDGYIDNISIDAISYLYDKNNTKPIEYNAYNLGVIDVPCSTKQ
ncbi:MAG: hypothetical protein WCG14_03760 [Chlamydiia bacterium]